MHRHPFRHHPQRLALNQPGRDRQQVVVRLAFPHRAGLAVVQDDEAVLPRPHHRTAAVDALQGEIVGRGQFQVVPGRTGLPIIYNSDMSILLTCYRWPHVHDSPFRS